MIGPLADTLYEDWYSGTLPYAVTACARPGRAARRGQRRASPRASTGSRCAVGAARSSWPARTRRRAAAPGRPTPPAPRRRFDVFDWGNGVLRAAGGRQRPARDRRRRRRAGQRPAAARTAGWCARRSGSSTGADGDARAAPRRERPLRRRRRRRRALRAGAETPEEATGFTDRAAPIGPRRGGPRRPATADVAVVVVGNHPLVNGRETEDRADLALPPAQEALLRAVHAANPRTVLVRAEQLPVRDRLGRRSTCRPSCGPRTAARSSGTRWPTCSSATPSPAGRLTQTWYRRRAELPDLLDYDIIAGRRDLPVLPRHAALPVRPRPDLHHVRLRATCG